MKFFKSQAGFSLIEVVIGMILLGILVTAVLTVTVGTDLGMFANKVILNSSCRTEANRLLNNFKSKGLVRSYYSFPFDGVTFTPGPLPAPGTAVRPTAIQASANEMGIDFTQRWATAPYEITNPTSSSSLIRPYSLIMGTITAVETIYNNNPAACTTPGLAASSAVPPLTNIFSMPGAASGLVNADAFLRIRAYDAAGVAVVCGTPLNTRPPRGGPRTVNQLPSGLNSPETGTNNYPIGPPPATTTSTVMNVGTTDPSVRDDLSWEVLISVSYTNRGGTVENCEVKERFQYPSLKPNDNLRLTPRDLTLSTELMNTSLTTNTPVGLNLDYTVLGNMPHRACTPTVNSQATADAASVGSIGLRIQNARPGSVFMCRNLSAQRPNAGITLAAGTFTINNTTDKRQTFYSTEVSQNASSFSVADSGANRGDLFFAGLYYPQGTYYCSFASGCAGPPRFPLGANDATGTVGNEFFMSQANERLYRPSDHGAATQTTYDTTNFTGTWVPCEYAQIRCASSVDGTLANISPTTARFVPGTGTTADSYELTYNGLAPGCEFHMQIAEVDAAYNVRATEVREYIHEPLPGNKLCFTGSAGLPGYGIDQWHFVCDSNLVDAITPVGGVNLLSCNILTPRDFTPGVRRRAVYNMSAPCCIDYPGDPQPTATGAQQGIWSSPPTVDRSFDPP